MTKHMTHVDYTDIYATVPYSDSGVGAWVPLSDDQRIGAACLDCDKTLYGAKHAVGSVEHLGAQWVVNVCPECYLERLRDHIDYRRPQS